MRELLGYLNAWKVRVTLASIYSGINKIFDIAPEVLIGVAVDLVVKKNDSFVASLGFESIDSQVAFIGAVTFLIWALESLFEYLYGLLKFDIVHLNLALDIISTKQAIKLIS